MKPTYLFPVEANTMIDRALPAATFSNEIVLLKLPLYYNQTTENIETDMRIARYI